MSFLKKAIVVSFIGLAGIGTGMGIGHAGGVENPEGGVWEYGTDNGSTGSPNYSIYNHSYRTHASSVRNCNGVVFSGWMSPQFQAVAKQNRCLTGNEAFWNVLDPALEGSTSY
ncbi:lactococcin 972 family bacteriocin [Nocardia sp. SSK8]|uniref:lactococcin 972 family bacteriocin n=1 Tax=Nocardia sp. SSK8 TaxID=3120154 RepID=UPI00300BF6AE